CCGLTCPSPDTFFFSSRRRHTRFSRDWSSDVCSSDLTAAAAHRVPDQGAARRGRAAVRRDRGCPADARAARGGRPRARDAGGGALMAGGTVFVSVSMSLDGYIAPSSPEELMGRKWRALHQWTFPLRFTRENLKLGPGGEEGLDDDIARATFERTGASVMGKRMFEAGEHAWPEEAP